MLKVIGAGLGRTGTFSLKTALEDIGFGPCFHMSELFENPERAPMFEAAFRGESVDWARVFAGYVSTLDWPSCTFYRELAETYPDGKVILTLRDPESWHKSVMDTIGYRGEGPREEHPEPDPDPAGHMIHTIIWNGTFDDRVHQKEYAIDVFNRHNQGVIETIAPERLLVYRLSQGWGPLCDFLRVEAPDKPMPHLNDTASFRANVLGIDAKTDPAVTTTD